MDIWWIVKTLHILSATVLFGTGLGIAFFFLMAHRQNDRAARALAARTTVRTDFCFTLPAVIVQPVTGIWLIRAGGHDWTAPWLLASYALYILAGACWLPVVWIQLRLARALETVTIPAEYAKLFRIWFALGWPAFAALVVICYLMVAKPT